MQGAVSNQPLPPASANTDLNARYVSLVCAAAALGGLLFGYDWVVIGGAKLFYEAYFRLTNSSEVGWANSCALLGCLLGSILSGSVSDRFGRKKLLVGSAVLFAVSSILTGLAHSFSEFVCWRIGGGIAIGVASNVSPTYIAEVSPAVWRGRLVALNQMTIVIGILLAQIVNWLIADRVPAGAASHEIIRSTWNGQWGWRWMFIVVAIPSLLFFLSALLVPESPPWLLLRHRKNQAQTIFERIGGSEYASSAIAFFAAAEEDRVERAGASHARSRRTFRRALIIGVTLAVLQQWSGINVLFNYAQEIYERAGYGANDVLFNIVITGAINLIFTLVALGTVDRLGRRPLMLFGCASITAAHLMIGTAYRAGATGLPILLLTLLTIGCYAMSLAPVTWVIISEIFPADLRSKGVATSVCALWIASFLLTFTFPILQDKLGASGVFLLYAFVCAAGFVFVYLAVPETKNKTLEQIEKELNAYASSRPVGLRFRRRSGPTSIRSETES